MRVLCACAVLALGLHASVVAAADGKQNIVVLGSRDSFQPAYEVFLSGLRPELKVAERGRIELFPEFLDASRFPQPEHTARMVSFLHDKYVTTKIDLVISVSPPAFNFLLQHRSAIFPGAPVVFALVSPHEVPPEPLPSDVIGVLDRFDPVRTLELALRLQPDARHLAVVTGAADLDTMWEAIARREFRPYEDRLETMYLSGLPLPDLLEQVARLPRNTIIFYCSVFRDGRGESFASPDVAEKISASASAPVYGLFETYLDRGLVGGYVNSFQAVGTVTARLALGLLAGETPEEVARHVGPAGAYIVDWRQLRRWGLAESRLPPDAVVRFRKPSAWELYRWYFVGGATLLVAQAVLIAGLLINRAGRRRAQRTLAERLRFETLLSELSTTFIMSLPNEADRVIDGMLERVVNALDLDQAVLAERHEGTSGIRITHSWTRAGMASVRSTIGERTFPWIGARLAAGEVVHFSRPALIPPEGAADQQSLIEAGIRSIAVVPLIVEGAVMGALGLSTLRAERVWPRELIARLQLLASVFANILARRRADAAVRESAERHRQAEDEARRQRDELAHALRVTTLGELTASLAHELNQPLAAIVTNAQAARYLVGTEVVKRDDALAALADIVDAARRASKIIDHVRALFQKRPSPRSLVDVNQLAEDVIDFVHHDIKRKQIALRGVFADQLSPVVADPVQLQQVLLNLIVNASEAIMAADSGPREITVETAARASGGVEIRVSDTGAGVPAEKLERIFERFITTKPDGLGMGLSISRSIVLAHGGRIWATNGVPRGLTMHVELPSANAHTTLVP